MSQQSRFQGACIALALSLCFATSCAGGGVAWRGTAVVPVEKATRESSISGVLGRTEYLEKARIVLDRSFETDGFRGVPFAIEAGNEQVLSIDSEHAALRIAFEDRVDARTAIVETFVPYFYLDTEVPGVEAPVHYTLVCVGGTGALRISRDGGSVGGDLAIRVACRTYAGGKELDESEILIDGPFQGSLTQPRSPAPR